MQEKQLAESVDLVNASVDSTEKIQVETENIHL